MIGRVCLWPTGSIVATASSWDDVEGRGLARAEVYLLPREQVIPSVRSLRTWLAGKINERRKTAAWFGGGLMRQPQWPAQWLSPLFMCLGCVHVCGSPAPALCSTSVLHAGFLRELQGIRSCLGLPNTSVGARASAPGGPTRAVDARLRLLTGQGRRHALFRQPRRIFDNCPGCQKFRLLWAPPPFDLLLSLDAPAIVAFVPAQ